MMRESLAKQHIAELRHDAAEHVDRGASNGSGIRSRVGRMLISLGTRLSPNDARATNGGRQLARN